MSLIKDGFTVLFQGDSITDVGRSREDDALLGAGYPIMVDSWLAALHPEKRIRVLNRGISGNRAKDLKARWCEDCIDLRPDIVSILIGINDTWRRYDSNDPTSAETYEENYRYILEETKNKTSAQIVILEPFLLPVPTIGTAWREDLDPKIHVARKLAAEFGAVFIPLDGIFAALCTYREPAFWSADGVHPTNAAER